MFLAEARNILKHMDTAVWRTREASTGLVGNLRVGFTKGYEQSNLPRRLRDFHREYPNILIACYRDDTDALAAGLMNMEYDIIFAWDSTDIRQEDHLQIRLVEKVPLFVAMYTGHPLARRPSLSRKELKGETILFMSPSRSGDSFGDAYYVQLYQKAGYQPNILLRTSDYESILMMIAAEQAICIVPEYCIGKLRSVENVVFCPLRGKEETEEILAAWHEKNLSPALRHFVERLD